MICLPVGYTLLQLTWQATLLDILNSEEIFNCHWESNELKAMKMCLVIQTMPFAIWQNDTKIQQHHAVGAELMIPYASVHESSFYWNGLVNIKLAGQKNR